MSVSLSSCLPLSTLTSSSLMLQLQLHWLICCSRCCRHRVFFWQFSIFMAHLAHTLPHCLQPSSTSPCQNLPLLLFNPILGFQLHMKSVFYAAYLFFSFCFRVNSIYGKGSIFHPPPPTNTYTPHASDWFPSNPFLRPPGSMYTQAAIVVNKRNKRCSGLIIHNLQLTTDWELHLHNSLIHLLYLCVFA